MYTHTSLVSVDQLERILHERVQGYRDSQEPLLYVKNIINACTCI